MASAYVFLFILPKLASQQAVLEQTTSECPFMEYFYHHAYIVALFGFATYYLTGMVNYVNQNGLPFDRRAKP